MITVEKVLHLRNVPLFAGMGSKELSALARIAEEVIYSAGARIIEFGEYGDCLFLIIDGKVRLTRGGRELSVITAPDYFGEISILDGEPRSASATALTDCLLLRIDQADFHEILRKHSQSAMVVIKNLTRMLRTQEDREAESDD